MPDLLWILIAFFAAAGVCAVLWSVGHRWLSPAAERTVTLRSRGVTADEVAYDLQRALWLYRYTGQTVELLFIDEELDEEARALVRGYERDSAPCRLISRKDYIAEYEI